MLLENIAQSSEKLQLPELLRWLYGISNDGCHGDGDVPFLFISEIFHFHIFVYNKTFLEEEQ